VNGVVGQPLARGAKVQVSFVQLVVSRVSRLVCCVAGGFVDRVLAKILRDVAR
jgi:hypothetical protein